MLTALLIATALQAAPALPVAALEKPKAEKKICRRNIATGSIMAMRTCHTPTDWATIDTDAADTTAEALRQRANASTAMRSTRDGT